MKNKRRNLNSRLFLEKLPYGGGFKEQYLDALSQLRNIVLCVIYLRWGLGIYSYQIEGPDLLIMKTIYPVWIAHEVFRVLLPVGEKDNVYQLLNESKDKVSATLFLTLLMFTIYFGVFFIGVVFLSADIGTILNSLFGFIDRRSDSYVYLGFLMVPVLIALSIIGFIAIAKIIEKYLKWSERQNIKDRRLKRNAKPSEGFERTKKRLADYMDKQKGK